MLKYKNILVSGGAGFIGSNLASKLIQRGYNVTILDNLSKLIHWPYKTPPLFRIIENNVTFIKGDVRNKQDWRQSLHNQDLVIHLASEIDTDQSMKQIRTYMDVNVGGTSLLCEELIRRKYSIRKVILGSSRAVYGEGKYLCIQHGIIYPKQREEAKLNLGKFELECPICNKILSPLPTDESSQYQPVSIYGITKQTQEQITINTCQMINIPYVIFRYQNVYGPEQVAGNSHSGILPTFARNVKNGTNIRVFEDGLESRDFVYIDDVVSATLLGIEKEEASGEVFNVGTGERISIMQIAEAIRNKSDSKVSIDITREYRKGDIRHNYADITKITQTVGFVPEVSFDDGVNKYMQWMQTI